MKKTITKLPQMKLVGITCRTNNDQLFESDPSTNKVAATVMTYFHNSLHNEISHRKTPKTTYCIYTKYESDHTGDYTYFIGEEVTSFEDVKSTFETLSIPAQNYVKFTNGPGSMPNVCIDAWKNIWSMPPSTLGGDRAYIADFEVYDERSRDHSNVTLDIYIGIKE